MRVQLRWESVADRAENRGVRRGVPVELVRCAEEIIGLGMRTPLTVSQIPPCEIEIVEEGTPCSLSQALTSISVSG
jgi:hypothetical protein